MKLRLIPGKEITFNSEEHTYTVDGRDAVSVTTILTEVGIAEDFSKLPPAVLQKVELARQRGITYDTLAEDAINAPYDLNEWQERFLKEVKNNIKSTDFETQVRLGVHLVDEDDNILLSIAGSPDFLGYLNDVFEDTTDLKATYQINEISVTWQTNAYTIMNLIKLNQLERQDEIKKYVLHFQEDQDTFTTKELQSIPVDIFILMLESYLNGKSFIEGGELTRNVDLESYSDLEEKLSTIESEINDFIEERKEEIDKIKESMKKIEDEVENLVDKAGLKQIKAGGYQFTLTRPSTRRNISYRNIYDEYEDLIFDELMPRLEDEQKEEIQKHMQEIVDKHIKIGTVKGNFKVDKIDSE